MADYNIYASGLTITGDYALVYIQTFVIGEVMKLSLNKNENFVEVKLKEEIWRFELRGKSLLVTVDGKEFDTITGALELYVTEGPFVYSEKQKEIFRVSALGPAFNPLTFNFFSTRSVLPSTTGKDVLILGVDEANQVQLELVNYSPAVGWYTDLQVLAWARIPDEEFGSLLNDLGEG